MNKQKKVVANYCEFGKIQYSIFSVTSLFPDDSALSQTTLRGEIFELFMGPMS